MQKRFITAFILLILVGVTSSCNKDDNKDNLVGTIWIGNFEDYKETIAFTSNTLCTLTEVNNNEDYRVTYQCSYTYNQPNITIKMESETLTGKISGDIMTLANRYSDIITFMKSN